MSLCVSVSGATQSWERGTLSQRGGEKTEDTHSIKTLFVYIQCPVSFNRSYCKQERIITRLKTKVEEEILSDPPGEERSGGRALFREGGGPRIL